MAERLICEGFTLCRTGLTKAVSELAREMELACRSGDPASVLAGHDRFLREYTDLADGLRSVMQTSG